MKIDDLILKLQQIKEISGNIEIFLVDTRYEEYNKLDYEDLITTDGYNEGIDGLCLKIGGL